MLTWDAPSDPDISHYLVRGTNITSPDSKEFTVPYDPDSEPNWSDMSVSANVWNYRYELVAVDFSGNRSAFSAQPDPSTGVPGIPSRTTLHAAVPNPFNPRTLISFDLATTSEVDLRVYDIAGHMIRSLINAEVRQPGRHDVPWNGQDNAGRTLAAGLYFYRLQAGDFVETRRMTLIK